MNRIERGRAAEDLATEHFRRAGYAIVARNLRSRFGEIDLIVERRDALVFVEVRSRSRSDYGTGLETVDRRKQARIVRSAAAFLARHRLEDRAVRFDVVGVEWQDGGPVLEHVENAFEVGEGW